MGVEPSVDDFVHQGEAVEGVAGIGDAARRIGFGAILLDIAPGQGRTAEHDRQVKTLAAHLFEVLAHDHGRFDQEARHADGVGLVPGGGFEDGANRLLDAEIDDPVAIVGQDDVDEVLADVVDVAAHRRQHHRAFFLALDPLHMRFEKAHRGLHRLGRLQDKGQLHLAGAEQLADGFHARQQDVVDDVERLPAFHRQTEIGFETLAVAIDDALGEPLFELFGAALFLGLLGGTVLEQRDKRMQRVVAVAAPVEDQILGDLRLLGRDAVQWHDPREMDDGAGQPAAQRVVEKDRVQDLPRRRVQAERDVREAEDDLALGHRPGDLLDRLQGVEAEPAIVLVAGADRKGQWVEQQVRGRQAVLVAGEIVEPAGDRELVAGLLCHAGLVDRQGDDRGAKPAGEAQALFSGVLAVLEIDRIDDRLATVKLQRCFEHRVFGRVR